MSFFISEALAEGAAAAETAQGPGPMFNFVMLGVFVLIFYFLLWRPQAKRQKEHKNLVASLSKGDEVLTSGGLLGKIVKVNEDFVSIEIANNLNVNVQKSAVSATLPKGTIKAL